MKYNTNNYHKIREPEVIVMVLVLVLAVVVVVAMISEIAMMAGVVNIVNTRVIDLNANRVWIW